MTGRRSHARFAVASPWQGVMRVLRDVVVNRTAREEVMAISHAPGVSGETMSLDLIGGGLALSLRVRVLESRPVIINGALRHRLRLCLLAPATGVRDVDLPRDVPPGTGAEVL
jgi:hypothetical protein